MSALKNNASPASSDRTDFSSTRYLDRLYHRLHYALGPVAGAVILDLADFATFGPLGLVIGWLAGAAVGWWISSLYGYSIRYRCIWAGLAAFYCTIPFTAIFPLATAISVIARFFDEDR